MLCIKCGKPLADGTKFCTACGTPQDQGQAPAPEPQQPPAPKPEPPQTPAPKPEPPQAPVPKPVSPAPAKVGPSGSMIGLLAAIAILAVAAIVLLVFLLRGGSENGSDPLTQTDPAASLTAEDGVSAAQPTDLPIDAPFDVSIMSGTYYCAQEAGSTLELYGSGDQLSIYKTYYGSADVSTLIEAPSGPSFTINYGGRLIEFYFSASGQSVTVTEGGYSSIFTTDGDRNWVVDATERSPDPSPAPRGYIPPPATQDIPDSDLYPLSEEEVKLIRNEIYARHGYSFTMDKFRDYFGQKDWYFEDPSVNASTFGTEQMNDYERSNVDVIKAYEEKMGW